MNTTVLAYMGDAVYDVRIRKMLIERMNAGESAPGMPGRSRSGVDKLHHMAIRYVSASAQAKAVKAMIKNGFLSEEEEAIVKRARNHRSVSKPKNADPRDYKYATAFEALLGQLFFDEKLDRMIAVVDEAVRLIEAG